MGGIWVLGGIGQLLGGNYPAPSGEYYYPTPSSNGFDLPCERTQRKAHSNGNPLEGANADFDGSRDCAYSNQRGYTALERQHAVLLVVLYSATADSRDVGFIHSTVGGMPG